MDRDQILSLLRARIVGWATFRLGRDRAEDLAHEVLVVLSEKYSHIEGLEDLLPLAFRILDLKIRNDTRLGLRHGEASVSSIDELLLEDPAPGPFGQTLLKERSEQLGEAMRRLSPECRELFRLLFEGRSQAEISRRLGQPVGTIYARHSRCKAALEKEVRKLGW